MSTSNKIKVVSKSFNKLFHVGTMDSSLKRDNSYEGAGLSVSTHPDEWRQIGGGYITGDTYIATKPNNSFIDAHKLSNATKTAITNWAVQHGLLEPAETVTVSWFDDEMGCTMESVYESMVNVEAEFDEEELENYEVVTNSNGFKPTDKLKQLTKNPTMSPTGLLDYVLPIFAEHHGYDGVWWQDRLNVSKYSAPRGVICKTDTWDFKKVAE